MEASDGKRQRGQSLVIVAVAMVVLVLFVAIAVDASDAYVHRRTAQNGADAAALAGGRELGMQLNQEMYDGSLIKAQMNNFAEQNDIPDTGGAPADALNNNVVGYYLDEEGNRLSEDPVGSPAGDAFLPNAWGIEAVAYITAPTFFGGIIGLNGMPVQADAAVMLEGVCADSCVVPIAAYQMNFAGIEGQCYKIWNGTQPGNFGWLNWSRQDPENCSCDAPCLVYNLNPATCRSGLINVGDLVAGDTGVSDKKQIREWLDYYRGSWPDDHTPVPFTVPVWDATGGTGCKDNGWYRVAGFAKVQLIAYKLSCGTQYGDVPDDCIELEPSSEHVSSAPKPTDTPAPGVTPTSTMKDCNWIAVTFIEWVEGLPGNCDPHGSLFTPRLVR